MRTRTLLSGTIFAVLALFAAPGLAGADDEFETIHQFAIEFTCGTNDGGFERLVPGDYTTVVNVYDAGPPTRARAKVSLSYPASSVSGWIQTDFDAMQARQLDCSDFVGGTFVFPVPFIETGYFQGFLVIQSPGTLDVTARYTASGADGEVTSDVEVIAPRKLKRRVEDDDGKAVVCHLPPGNPSNAHTIRVDESAVPAHIAHGDYEGYCDGEETEDDEPVGESFEGRIQGGPRGLIGEWTVAGRRFQVTNQTDLDQGSGPFNYNVCVEVDLLGDTASKVTSRPSGECD